MKSVKPNFLVIGAEKSGTTWMYNKLKEHPEIYLPLTKECHFFNKYNSNLKEIDHYNNLGWDWYQQFFNEVPDEAKVFGEITPMYICDPLAPERIAKDLPNAKLIYILRNPIERAYSHYWMALRKGHIDKSFEEIVTEKDPKIIQRGKYAEQLEKYYTLFPEQNIRGFIHESFFKNTYQGLKDIHSFLGLEEQDQVTKGESKKILASPKPKSQLLYQIIGKTAKKMRKYPFSFRLLDWFKKVGIASSIKEWNIDSEPYPPMEESLYYELLNYYKTDIEKLEAKLNVNVDFWKQYSE